MVSCHLVLWNGKGGGGVTWWRVGWQRSWFVTVRLAVGGMLAICERRGWEYLGGRGTIGMVMP